VYYPQLKVSAAGLVVSEGKLLLVQRALPPWQGCWYIPAGYVEADEPPARAAEREVLEETGLLVRTTGLRDLYYFDDDPRGSGLLIVYECHLLGGQPTVTAEALAYGFFGPAELPSPLAGAGHERAIPAWAAGAGSPCCGESRRGA